MDYRQFQQMQQAGMDIMSSANNHPMIGYPPHIIEASWQIKIPKQEPMDDRDDSGINSGNSSPNSESSRDILNPYTTPPPSVPGATRPLINGGYSPPPPESFSSDPLAAMKAMYSAPVNAEEFNFSTPVHQRPAFPQNNLLSPPMSEPSTETNKDNEDALQNLQMALKQNSLLAMPANNNNNNNHHHKGSSDEGRSDDDATSKTPKSSSKKKTIKCKHCSLTFVNKEDMWDHYRSHIKQEKLLECPKCAFVTEYKHHFEYHLRNHDGSKPFKCQECSYECVSKSMLNSHMKSHSTVYQYQCANCTYVSKYCHSLKQHLRKYNHKPGTVLSPDGSPNPFSVIDVYGTRRGPKLKKSSSGTAQPETPQVPNIMNPFLMNPKPQLPQFPQFPILPQLQEQMSQFFNPLLLSNPALLQNLERIARERQLSNSTEETDNDVEEVRAPKEEPMDEEDKEDQDTDSGALDLSKSHKNKRKGPAFKLSPERSNDSSEEDEDDHLTTMFSNVEVVQEKEKEAPEPEKKTSTMCQYCNIDFHDEVLYSMHMGYHGFNNPFTCNLCGESYPDKVRFFLHIGQKQH